MSCKTCDEQFRFNFCDLRTGTVRAVYNVLSAEWTELLNGFGQGTITVPTKAVRARDIWPHLTSVYVERVAGGSATTASPVVEWAGMIENADASTDNVTTLGLQCLEYYLWHRMIRTDMNFEGVDQNSLAATLVNHPNLDRGIPLSGAFEPSSRTRIRHYQSWRRKIIGEAIQQYSEVIEGPDWEMSHSKSGGKFSSTMTFRDSGEVGEDRGVTLTHDVNTLDYGLTVDAVDHATFVDALGEGEEDAMLIAHAEDPANIYPRFDAAPAWKDVSRIQTLQEHADGYLEDHKEPYAVPSATVYGLDPDPNELRLGDTVRVDVGFGVVTYKGGARITEQSWRLGPDEPLVRRLALQPSTRASESVLNQTPDDDCKDC